MVYRITISLSKDYPQIRIVVIIANATIVKIVPNAAVDSSKKLSLMALLFVSKL